eukprot:m51a1_g8249 hypothetical protein (418) ;mRNA; r:137498-138933
MVFFEGQPVTGVVRLDLAEPKRCRSVTVRLTGMAHSGWTESHQERDREGRMHTRHRHVSQTHTLLDVQCLLWSPAPGAETVMPPGQYTMPFAFVLPRGLPASYTSPLGHVRYTLKATVDRPWRFDHKVYRCLSVLPVVDANAPNLNVEVRRADEKTVCCCCCASGPIVAEACVPSLAWCPGEVAPVRVRLTNRSGKALEGVSCQLVQRAVWYAEGHSRSEQQRLASVDWPQRVVDSADVTLAVRVPSCCPSITRMAAGVLDLGYVLRVVVRLPAGSFDMSLSLPFEVATIPHASQQWASAQAVIDYVSRATVPSGMQQPQQWLATLPQPPAYEDTYANAEPTAEQLGAQARYVYFPASTAPSAPPAPMAGTQQQGREDQPLMGGSVSQQASLPPPPPAFQSMCFAAQTAGVPVTDQK